LYLYAVRKRIMSCPYQEVIGNKAGGGTVVCSEIVRRVGMRCNHPLGACEKCNYASGDDSFVRDMAKRHLKNLLISGNGRTNFADVIDVPATAARFKAMATEEERREIMRKAIDFQCVLPERHGHLPDKAYANLVELEGGLEVAGALEAETIRGPADVERRQRRHGVTLPKCLHEGTLIEVRQTSCCGQQRYFFCNKLGHEVYESKCRSCEHYQVVSGGTASCPIAPKGLFVCETFTLVVSAAICRRCRRDPRFRNRLLDEYVRNRAARNGRCKWITEVLEPEQVPCCGGEHVVSIDTFHCALHKRVAQVDCWVCPDYREG